VLSFGSLLVLVLIHIFSLRRHIFAAAAFYPHALFLRLILLQKVACLTLRSPFLFDLLQLQTAQLVFTTLPSVFAK
jgi:hypothetical protein